MPTITPCLWFDGRAEEAAAFYASVFPGSEVVSIMRSPADNPSTKAGDVLMVSFTISGQPFTALNGGPAFAFTEAVSFEIVCADQAEVDRYWEALVEGGGEHSVCGWLKDRFGVSWQVTPRQIGDYLGGPDPETTDEPWRPCWRWTSWTSKRSAAPTKARPTEARPTEARPTPRGQAPSPAGSVRTGMRLSTR